MLEGLEDRCVIQVDELVNRKIYVDPDPKAMQILDQLFICDDGVCRYERMCDVDDLSSSISHILLEQRKCPDCRHPAWPGSIACPTLFKRTWTPPHFCLLCGFDMRLSPVVLADVDERISMAGEFLDSDVPLGSDRVVSAATYASAAWSVTQLFIRRRSQALIQEGPTPTSDLVELVKKESAVRSVEDLPIGVRGRVVGQAHALFDGWPEVLLDLCEACGLSAQHFSGDRSTLPSWFDEAIRRTVRRQVRGVSSQEVSEALYRLQQSGDRVSKAAVSRLVGAKQAKAIDEVLDRRTEASVLELFHLTGQLVKATQKAARRRSSIEVRLRDASMILLSILCRLELSMVSKFDVDWTQQGVYDLTRDHGATEARRHVVQALDAFLLRYAEIQHGLSLDRVARDRTLMFVPFRGDNPCARSAGRMLGQCMNGMDPRLVRSVRSFFEVSV